MPDPQVNGRTFHVEGAGGVAYPGITLYMLLAVKNLKTDDALLAVADDFIKVSRFANNYIGGEVVDIEENHTIRDMLKQSQSGASLYHRIYEMCPVICISNSFIGDIANSDNVELVEFSKFRENSMLYITDWTNRADAAAGSRAKEGLKEILLLWNKIIVLRPTIFGFGLNLNEGIEKILSRKIDSSSAGGPKSWKIGRQT